MRIFSGNGQPCVSWEIVHTARARGFPLSSPDADLLHVEPRGVPALSGLRHAGSTAKSKGTNGSP